MAAKNAQRQRRARGSISREEILEGAFTVAERDTIEKLSMPELARHLGIGVTSIYWYFRKKEDLLGAMTEMGLRWSHDKLPRPTEEDEWRPFLERYFRSMRQVYREDDTVADLALLHTRTYTLDATHIVYRHLEELLQLLIRTGFPPEKGWQMLGALTVFIEGHIMAERIQRVNESPTNDERQVKLVEPETMPEISALVAENRISLGMVQGGTFEFGLTAMLDSFERLLEQERSDAG